MNGAEVPNAVLLPIASVDTKTQRANVCRGEACHVLCCNLKDKDLRMKAMSMSK